MPATAQPAHRRDRVDRATDDREQRERAEHVERLIGRVEVALHSDRRGA
jgi:hypothetical protein